ncbi:MAG: hypothetical protein LKF79_00900 [Solobacterium sp.]|jgi:hypothetical protein|nr:hypothetical protein [Solobacterium sp.]MCH4221862.1 hypothetical protein [Solobacterium sp.]MCH4265185.1 hypothetical protein [Solobacterium sp.]
MIRTLLTVISGLAWSLVYINCIRTGQKQHTWCMPLYALGLNIAWEGIYSFVDLFVLHTISAQAIANTCWFLLDIWLVVLYFKYAGKDCASETERKWFIPWTVLSLLICFGLQLLFLYEFGIDQAIIYSAYLQNVLMSVLFLYMLNKRKSSRGQTMTIAVSKWIGTLAPTVIGFMEHNLFIAVCGIMCLILDLLYIYFLNSVIKTEAQALNGTGH